MGRPYPLSRHWLANEVLEDTGIVDEFDIHDECGTVICHVTVDTGESAVSRYVREIDDPTSELWTAHQNLKRLNDIFRRYGLEVLIIDSSTRVPLSLVHQVTLMDDKERDGHDGDVPGERRA